MIASWACARVGFESAFNKQTASKRLLVLVLMQPGWTLLTDPACSREGTMVVQRIELVSARLRDFPTHEVWTAGRPDPESRHGVKCGASAGQNGWQQGTTDNRINTTICVKIPTPQGCGPSPSAMCGGGICVQSGRRDLNPRPLAPQASALAKLRYGPNHRYTLCNRFNTYWQRLFLKPVRFHLRQSNWERLLAHLKPPRIPVSLRSSTYRGGDAHLPTN